MTSESVSSDGISASSFPTGRTNSVPSAYGIRSASDCPPSFSAKPKKPPRTQDVGSPSRQKTQVPSENANGITTTAPRFIVRTSLPTSATTPIASWPMRRPVALGSMDLYGHRSLPQTQARLTATTASVGSTMRASGTFSTRTSPARYMMVARMMMYLRYQTMLSVEFLSDSPPS